MRKRVAWIKKIETKIGEIPINRKGKGIKPNMRVANEELQQYVWNATWKVLQKNKNTDHQQLIEES